MPPTNPGKFGTKKSPATLDISQIITKVEWVVGPNILMLHFFAASSAHPPRSVTLSAIGIETLSNVFDDTIHQHDDHTPPPEVVLPKISADMIAHSLVWNKAPKKRHTSDGDDWRGVLFLNLGRIKSFKEDVIDDPENYEITIRFPASEKITEPETLYYAFTDTFGWEYARDHPFTTGAVIDAEGHTGIVNTVILFSTPAQRAEFLGWNAGSAPPWVAHDEPTTGDVADLFRWELKAYTFKRRKEFPLKTDTLEPDFPIDDDKAKDFEEDSAHATFDVQIPAYTVTITVNLKTLEMEMRKV